MKKIFPDAIALQANNATTLTKVANQKTAIKPENLALAQNKHQYTIQLGMEGTVDAKSKKSIF